MSLEQADWYLQRWLAASDPVTGMPVVIDVVHHEVHEGEMFHAENTFGTVANGGTVDVLFLPGTVKECHTTWEVFAGGQVAVFLYETVTASANGSAVPAWNMKRNNAGTPSAVVTHTPTVTDVGGTALINGRVLPGGNSPQTRVGGGIRSGAEWIFKPATKYLMRVVNTSGSGIAVNVGLEWYEETPA